jgi:hypothetical protein
MDRSARGTSEENDGRIGSPAVPMKQFGIKGRIRPFKSRNEPRPAGLIGDKEIREETAIIGELFGSCRDRPRGTPIARPSRWPP